MWGYILSHWRGEQSLARSYWVNMLLLTFVLSACLNTSESILQDDLNSPWQLFAWVAGIYSACFIIWIWQAVGCWRSANGRITKTGKLGWARLVQALIVLGVFANLAGLKSVAQMTNEVFNVVTRTDNMQDVHITLLDGTELAINGFITFDVPVEVEKYLKYNPNIKYLHLNSPGGRIGPARDLRDLVEVHNLSTYSETGCYSACTIVFMAGMHRVLRVGAELGFHQASMPGLSQAELSAENSIDKQYFMRKGIQGWFVVKAFSTPSQELWIPTLGDLWRSNAITHVIDDGSLQTAHEYCSGIDCDGIS